MRWRQPRKCDGAVTALRDPIGSIGNRVCRGAAVAIPADLASASLSWIEDVLHCLTEIEVAAWMADLGFRVIEHHGRYWMAAKAGFYQPVHPLAQLRADEATAPTFACWGFRARLTAPDATVANACMPVHMLPDLSGYGLGRLSPKRRKQIRKAQKSMDLVALTSPDILLDQGYNIAREASQLNPGNKLLSEPAFRRWVLSHFQHRRGLLLAGLKYGRLLGFSSIWLADGIAYQDRLFVGIEGRAQDLALALNHTSAALTSRHPHARELVCGRHRPEHPGISAFKHGMGLRVSHVPARIALAPLAEPLLRALHPHAYYRLTGRTSAESPADGRFTAVLSGWSGKRPDDGGRPSRRHPGQIGEGEAG